MDILFIIWGFVALVTVVCGLTMRYADELEQWGQHSLRPWIHKHFPK